MWQGRGKTAIAGIGYSGITRRPEKPLGLLAVDACRAAIADAGLEPHQIDGLTTYPESPFAGAGSRDGEDVVSVVYIINHLPLAPDIRWYAQIETGMIASPLIEGIHALLAGACDYVLVWRALHRPQPRASSGTGAKAAAAPRASGDAQFMSPYGCNTIIQWHALAWQRYMHRYGASRDALAA
ncbi:MAG: thiolase C-terminal domain-containing protein, partial [Gammaproteobacteria bacterium]